MIRIQKQKQFGRQFLVLLALLLSQQLVTGQQNTPVASGIVQNESGEPLSGVSIKVVNRGLGVDQTTSTDAKGSFNFGQLPVGNSYSFIVSSIGYDTKQLDGYAIVAGKPVSLTVTLTESSTELSQIVVVGYGSTKRENVIGAVQSVTKESFNSGIFSSPAELLQGKVAGLNITKSGDPNNKGSIILRGPSTLREGAQEPFYVIDGIPGASIDLVSPDDIVSVDVLKDASSTAIYGSRAANGVIMITTRKATAGQSRLSYSVYGAAEQVSNTIDMLSGPQLRQYLEDNGKSLNASDDDGSNTNWQDEVSRTGMSQNHNLSFMGGMNNTSYGASINYLKNEGIIKGTSLERFIFRSNVQHREFNDRLKLSLSLSNSTSNKVDVDELVYSNMLKYLPTVGVKRADGTYFEDWSRTRNYLNPVSLIDNNTFDGKNKTFLVSGQAELKILDELMYTVNVSSQDEQLSNDIYYNRFSGLYQNVNGRAVRNTINNTKKILETYFNYDKGFGDHDLKLLAGYSWQEDKLGNGFQTTNQGFVNDELGYNNPGLGDPPAGVVVDYGDMRIQTQRIISFYGRVNYAYNSRYLLQASVRRDGSSAFGKNNQWGYFPAGSVGWLIHKEKFMEQLPAIQELKLRVSYGISGNSQGFDAFTSTLLYGSAQRFYYNGAYINAIGPFQNANPDLKWERTAMFNLGVDFGLFNGLISGSVDIYDKRTSDLIWTYPVSTTQYFVNQLTANAGEVSNKGIEVLLNAAPINNNNFTWRTSLNFSHNKSNLESLSNDNFELPLIYTAELGGKGQSGNSSQIVKEGYPIGTFYTWRYAGKNENGVTQIYDKDGNPTTAPSSSDFAYTGSAQPKLIYGWSNSFKYKDFDFNFFLRGVYGNKILNATLADMNSPGEATFTNIPVFTLGESPVDNNAYYLSDRFIESGSYLRLDNATLGYTFQLKKKNSSLRLYTTANNLFVITDYRGIDPEVNMGGLTPGIDNGNYYPKTRSFILGLNVTF